MLYENDDWNNIDKVERNAYWWVLKQIRKEYLEENKGQYDLTARPTMHYWAEEKYGLKMGIDGNGDYTANYTVTDPKKFMLLQIKYWR